MTCCFLLNVLTRRSWQTKTVYSKIKILEDTTILVEVTQTTQYAVDIVIVRKTLITTMYHSTTMRRIRVRHPWFWAMWEINRFVFIVTNRDILKRIVTSCVTIFRGVGMVVETVGLNVDVFLVGAVCG
jgi:hypothetical protein